MDLVCERKLPRMANSTSSDMNMASGCPVFQVCTTYACVSCCFLFSHVNQTDCCRLYLASPRCQRLLEAGRWRRWMNSWHLGSWNMEWRKGLRLQSCHRAVQEWTIRNAFNSIHRDKYWNWHLGCSTNWADSRRCATRRSFGASSLLLHHSQPVLSTGVRTEPKGGYNWKTCNHLYQSWHQGFLSPRSPIGDVSSISETLPETWYPKYHALCALWLFGFYCCLWWPCPTYCAISSPWDSLPNRDKEIEQPLLLPQKCLDWYSVQNQIFFTKLIIVQ